VTVVISEDAIDRLRVEPDQLFEASTVCIIGVLQEVDDGFQIVINEPADIVIL
jgi:hypothetical protein